MANRKLLHAALPLVLALNACGDEDPPTDDAKSGDVSAYCEAAAELEASETEPTDEDFDRLIELAPDEIADDVTALVEANKTREFDAEVEIHETNLLAWEAEHCGDTFGGEQEESTEG